MNKAKELIDQSLPELEALCQEAYKSLFTLVNQRKLEKKNEQSSHIRNTRKDIARLLTIITQKRRQKQHK